MSIYIGNDLEDRLKILETENSLLRKYNEYHQMVHEIDHMSDLHVDSSSYKQSMKIDNYHKIAEWINSSAMQQYFLVTGTQLEPLPPKPVLSDFYVPSEDHHNQELAFITLSMIGIGAFLWYSDK